MYVKYNHVTEYIIPKDRERKEEVTQRLSVIQENNVYNDTFTEVFGNIVARAYQKK